MFYKVLLRNFWSHSLSEALSHPASAQVSSSLSWTCVLKITWTTAGGIWGPMLLFFLFFLLLFHICNVSFIFIWRRLDSFLRIVCLSLPLSSSSLFWIQFILPGSWPSRKVKHFPKETVSTEFFLVQFVTNIIRKAVSFEISALCLIESVRIVSWLLRSREA